jgi:hypothetical protein
MSDRKKGHINLGGTGFGVQSVLQYFMSKADK